MLTTTPVAVLFAYCIWLLRNCGRTGQRALRLVVHKTILCSSPAVPWLIAVFVLIACASTQAANTTYIYDELGRVVGVVDAAGNAATYNYDAAGNLLSITRQTPSQVTIIDFTPNGGPVGTAVTISGTGFGAIPSQNTVKFNGVAATVTTATANTLTTAVPSGATTGKISVTSPNGSATTAASFTVTGSEVPTITGFTPTLGGAGTLVTISGANFDAVSPNNKVLFNSALAVVTTASTTSTP